MLPCTNNTDFPWFPWLLVVLLVVVVVVAPAAMPSHLIDLMVFLVIALMGASLGLAMYKLDWAEN